MGKMLLDSFSSVNRSPSTQIHIKKARPKPSKVFDTYWHFAAERQSVFFKKLQNEAAPWTKDSILQKHKFTNAYRASDRVSQYLIRNVIYSGNHSAKDTLFRTLLFKLFNKIETWELLNDQFGEICLDNFNVKNYNNVLDNAIDAKGKIYSAAYIMPSGSSKKYKGKRKHLFHLELLASLIQDAFFEELLNAKDMEESFTKLLSIPSFGNFLAYQFITDLNYSPYLDFSEMEFVMPGPGAKDGIKKCFTDLGEYSEQDVIKLVAEEQNEHFERLGISFQDLFGRPLQLIDCQNLFCEVDKYSRVFHPDVVGHSKRTRIKQVYAAKQKPLKVFYPPKWELHYIK